MLEAFVPGRPEYHPGFSGPSELAAGEAALGYAGRAYESLYWRNL
jgi:hypothetical protein